MGVRLEVQLAAATIGYVGVELGRGQIRVPQHLLNRPEIGSALEQMCREGVAQQMRMDALGLETGRCCEASQDEECAGAREPAALGVQEELGPVALVEVRATAREVAAQLSCYCRTKVD